MSIHRINEAWVNGEMWIAEHMGADIGLLTKLGLAEKNKPNGKYYSLTYLYKFILESVLVKKLNLDAYDNTIREYRYPSVPLSEAKRSRAHRLSTTALDYIYLRNQIHIERLEESDIRLMLSELEKQDGHNTEVLTEMVKRTFRKVITHHAGADVQVVYEQRFFSGNVTAPGGAILLMVAAAPRYDDNGNYNEDEEEKRVDFIERLCRKLSKDATGALGIQVSVFPDF